MVKRRKKSKDVSGAYRKYVKKRIEALYPIFARAAVGDFSTHLSIPDSDDEFAVLYSGIEIMAEAARRRMIDLQEKTEALSQAQRITQVGSWEVDVRARKVRWSDQMYHLFGLAREHFAPTYESFLMLVHPEDQKQFRHTLERCQTTRKPFDFDYRILTPNGTTRWHHAKGSLITDESGESLKILGTSQDITDRYIMDRAKSEFVSLASHQMRSPLTVVKWYVDELLRERGGSLKKHQRKYLNIVFQANERMVSLIDTLLNVSRLELGTFAIEPKPLDMQKIIRAVIEELRIPIKRARLRIKEEYDPRVPHLKLDPDMILLVMQNLISNAVRYTRPGGSISISVAVKHGHVREKAGSKRGTIALVVADNGIGIPPEEQSKIFTKLYRANNARTMDPNGTGLGLYIVKAILDIIGGSISFTSTLGKGTTFTIHLPITDMKARPGTTRLDVPFIRKFQPT